MKNDLTLLMCVHSRDDYHDSLFLDSLESIKSQTYKNFKTLIVLDGCWEETKKKINHNQYDFDFDVLIKDKKEGLSLAKNFGLEQVNTEWVCFLDADDLLLPDKIMKQLEYIKNNDVDFLGTLCWNINGNDKENLFPSCFSVGQYETHDEIEKIITKENVLTHWSMMIRKNSLTKLGGYIHKVGMEDWDLWQRAISHGFKFHQLQERLYILRLGTSVPR